MSATLFERKGRYNINGMSNQLRASFFSPFQWFGLSSSFRIRAEYNMYDNGDISNFFLDLGTRLSRLNLRLSYQSTLFSTVESSLLSYHRLSSDCTYSFSTNSSLPKPFRGLYIRAKSQGWIHPTRWTSVGLQNGRIFRGKSRFTLGVEHLFSSHNTQIVIGMVIDLKQVRLSSHYSNSQANNVFQQSFSGSVGLDAINNQMLFYNRDMANKSAIAVLMFIDNNNNARYDKGEPRIPAKALKLDKSASFEVGIDSILRVSQLQSYWTYNAEIIPSAIADPTLAPLFRLFSFEAAPDCYKQIEVPFYRTGVLEGNVFMKNDSAYIGLAGIRLFLVGLETKDTTVIRTFSDGSYYKMGLMPGRYLIQIDPVQLQFLNVTGSPEIIHF